MLQQRKTLPIFQNIGSGSFLLGLILIITIACISQYLSSLSWIKTTGLVTIPNSILDLINSADTLFLTMAMAALGVRTHLGAIRQAGIKPLLLAGSLFIFLIVGSYAINLGIHHLFING